MWTLIQKLQQDPSTSNTFSWKNDSLWYKDLLYICKNSQLKKNILLELHTSPLGGPSGFLKTYHRVKKYFFWDHLKFDIQKFVAECLVFQQKNFRQLRPRVCKNIQMWMNGRRKNKCGHSLKSCNKILVHLIHLVGKMILYGAKIAYIFVIILK